MFMEMARTALRAIFAQKMRSFLVVLGVAIGVIAVAGMTTIAVSLNDAIRAQFAIMGSDTFSLMRISPINFVSFGQPKRASNGKSIWQRDRLELSYLVALKQDCTDCEAIAPIATYEGIPIASGKNNITTNKVLGVTREYLGVFESNLAAGRFISELDTERRRYVCVVGESIVRDVFNGANPIGRKLKIRGIPFIVIGIMEPLGNTMGVDTDNYVLVPVTTALHHWSGWWGIQYSIKAKQGKFESAQGQVIETMRRLRHLKANEPDDFDILTSQLMLALLTTILASVYAVAVGIALMSLVVAGIGIMNVMFVSVAERTKEIGIRKACGAAPKTIMTQFTVEAAILSLLGGIVGVAVISLGVFFLNDLLELFTETKLPFAISQNPYIILLGLLFSATAGIIFGYFPARGAAKMPPVEALRWE